MNYIAVRRWLEQSAQIEPSLLEGSGFDTVVGERIAAVGAGEAGYVDQLFRSPSEADRLVAGIAVPETWLFRYPRAFDLLLDLFARRLASGASSVRAASIGCATGQEAYCIAMTALHAGWPPDRVRIDGFDRNREFLRTAEAGVFGASSIRTELPAWAVPFLRRSGDSIEMDPVLRRSLRFSRVDVTDPGAASEAGPLRAAGPFEAVFCRNLLIYLNADARRRLLDAITGMLAPGGLLFVGHAEQLIRGGSRLRPVNAPHAFALEQGEPVPLFVEPPLVVSRAPVVPSRAGARAQPAPTPAAPAPRFDQATGGEGSLEDARELADEGRLQEADAMLRRLAAIGGPSAATFELHGLVRLALRDDAEARKFFEQALYLDPARSAAALQLAVISERAGDARRASLYWDRARRAGAATTQTEPKA